MTKTPSFIQVILRSQAYDLTFIDVCLVYDPKQRKKCLMSICILSCFETSRPESTVISENKT